MAYNKWEFNKNGSFLIILTLYLLNFPIIKWNISKNISDFIIFNQKLKKLLKNDLPEFPEIGFLIEDKEIEKKGKNITKYLKKILNEKINFCEFLFNFIELKKENLEKLHQIKVLNLKNSISEVNFSKIYQNYRVTIRTHDKIISFCKEFNDFFKLHDKLLLRYSPIILPQFPLNLFENFNEKNLQNYLNQLLQVENIEDSYFFRKFINFDLKYKKFII